MKLDNGILKLEVENKGGEMSSLIYEGKEILYGGKGQYWSGKNPTLFPIISSPDAKQYTLDGITYPIKNHGLIRYLSLETVKEDDKEIIMSIKANEETLKNYPFNFEYLIKYHLDDHKVCIEYEIKNNDAKKMPFTFGIHPGFLVEDKSYTNIYFKDDKEGELITDNKTKSKKIIKLDHYDYQTFLDDIDKYQTVILNPLKSKIITLENKTYKVNIDMSDFKYLALWTPNKDAEFLCIEPWLSINYIKDTTNPFGSEFELEYLNPNETFKLGYTIEVR